MFIWSLLPQTFVISMNKLKSYLCIEIQFYLKFLGGVFNQTLSIYDPDQNPPQSYIAGLLQVQTSHHRSSGSNTGSNSGGGRIKKWFCYLAGNYYFLVVDSLEQTNNFFKYRCILIKHLGRFIIGSFQHLDNGKVSDMNTLVDG